MVKGRVLKREEGLLTVTGICGAFIETCVFLVVTDLNVTDTCFGF